MSQRKETTWYARNKARARENARRWAAANPDKVAAKKERFAAKHPERLRQYTKDWLQRNPAYTNQNRLQYPDRYAAHKAVACAIARGDLSPLPCWECNAAKTEAHHADYSRPLDVVWLCRKHHKQIHKEFA